MSTLIVSKNRLISLITIWFPFGVATKKATDPGRMIVKDIFASPGNGFIPQKHTAWFQRTICNNKLLNGRTVYTLLFSGVFWGLQDTIMKYIEDFSKEDRSIGLPYHENKIVFVR